MRKFMSMLCVLATCTVCSAQYYSIDCDTQNPTEEYVIDGVFCGNTPYLRAYVYEKDVAINLTDWTMQFVYSYGQYDTNGVIQIAGTVGGTSTNCATFLGATNVFFRAFDNYYFSIIGTHTTGYIKTFATGRMIQYYDPATATNLPALMGSINMTWWTNNVGAQVTSNETQIAILVTGKVDQVDFLASNVVYVARFVALEAVDTAQGNTNAGFEVRIASNETFRVTTQPATNAVLQAQITTNLVGQAVSNAAFEVRVASNDTFRVAQVNTNADYEDRIVVLEGGSTTVTKLNALTIANVSKLNSNISGLTSTTYTGSVTTVAYTGVTATVVGRTYVWGFTKQNANGTGTLSVAGESMTATVAGLASNYFTASTTNTDLVLTLIGTGSAKSDAMNVFVYQVTNGTMNVADRLNVGEGGVYVDGKSVVFAATSDGQQYCYIDGAWAVITGYVSKTEAEYTNAVALATGAYPASNPSNFIDATTGEALWVAASNGVVYLVTAAYTDAVAKATAAYPASNPSNFLTSADVSMTRYAANTNSGESVWVLASNSGVTATRTNSTWYYYIPVGVQLISSDHRVNGSYTDSGKIYLSMGTNDMNNSTMATSVTPTTSCYQEDTLGIRVLTAKPKQADNTLTEVSGMGTTAGIIYHAHFTW